MIIRINVHGIWIKCYLRRQSLNWNIVFEFFLVLLQPARHIERRRPYENKNAEWACLQATNKKFRIIFLLSRSVENNRCSNCLYSRQQVATKTIEYQPTFLVSLAIAKAEPRYRYCTFICFFNTTARRDSEEVTTDIPSPFSILSAPGPLSPISRRLPFPVVFLN